MSREIIRASKKLGRALMRLPHNNFAEIPFSELVARSSIYNKNCPDRAWKNNHYVALFYRNKLVFCDKSFDKLMIRRNDGEKITEWHELQRIKSLIVGEEQFAIQFFPKDSELVDAANMYWLFILNGIL